MGLFFLQQLSGINAVIYYAPQIFRETGFATQETQLLATIGIGVVNVGMTVVGMWLVERIGRRRLLLIGFVGTTVSLAAIALTIAPGGNDEIVTFIGVGVFIAAFAVSLGPLPYVLMSEIFPLDVRGHGMALASVTNWGFNFLVVFTFPELLALIGVAGTFGIFAAMCFVGILFGWLLVPETRNVSLERIESYLRSGAPLRHLKPV
jgi:MFS family permease